MKKAKQAKCDKTRKSRSVQTPSTEAIATEQKTSRHRAHDFLAGVRCFKAFIKPREHQGTGSVAETGRSSTIVLRDAYRIDGDGVAHADLNKLLKREGFKKSAKRIIERNKAVKAEIKASGELGSTLKASRNT